MFWMRNKDNNFPIQTPIWRPQMIRALTQENLSSGVCEQQRRRPACTSVQSDQRFCYYPPTKSEGYSFGVVRASVRLSVHSVRPSVHTFCLSGTISQYLLVRFDSFLVQMISTMDSRYPISLVKINTSTLELLPLFKYRQL